MDICKTFGNQNGLSPWKSSLADIGLVGAVGLAAKGLIRFLPGATSGGIVAVSALTATACACHNMIFGYDPSNKMKALFLAGLAVAGASCCLSGCVAIPLAQAAKLFAAGSATILIKEVVKVCHIVMNPKPEELKKTSDPDDTVEEVEMTQVGLKNPNLPKVL